MFLFFPLGTTRPCKRIPYATYGLIAVNSLVYALELTMHEPERSLGFVAAQPSPITWLTSMFAHAGILHLAGNMLFLWLFGTLAEDTLGLKVFLGFYFGGEVGATFLHVLMGNVFNPADLTIPSVGASGAIAGIMGLSAICFIRTKVRVWYFFWYMITIMRSGVAEIGAPLFLGLWVGWEALQGMITTSMAASMGESAGGVAHWAHVGGFLAGLGGALAFGLNKSISRSDLVTGRRERRASSEGYTEIADLDQMIKRDPNDADAWYAIGREWEKNGMTDKACDAYDHAAMLFLQQRRSQEAAKAYQALVAYGKIVAVPPAMRFGLACALEEAGRHKEAFELFRQIATTQMLDVEAETALIRAGDIARVSLRQYEQARECYSVLLKDYPFSQWRALAEQRLQEVQPLIHVPPQPIKQSPLPSDVSSAPTSLQPLTMSSEKSLPNEIPSASLVIKHGRLQRKSLEEEKSERSDSEVRPDNC